MAVGSGEIGVLYPVAGVKIGIASAGIKKPGRRDTVIFELCDGATVAGVFTLNRFCAAPVHVAKRHIARGNIRYLMVNTGNANAGTGEEGLRNAARSCEALASLVGCASEQVLPFSTGVIGERLPIEKLESALPAALENLSPDHWLDASHGIMTTDTRPKAASKQISIHGQVVTITGIAKGAGMIKPNMATMLGYVATDAAIERDLLQGLLDRACNMSFNRISVDGDTSTNDACILVASGASGVKLSPSDDAFDDFAEALFEIFVTLAQGLVRDGEGATKFVTVNVDGGKTTQESLSVAYTIAESPLVKTALFASDPNWGRLLAAIGRAGIDDLDVEGVSVYLGDVLIAEKGARALSYTEQAGQAVMRQEEIEINIHLGRGDARETVWTTDFSYDYVKINAEYRT
ncbi:MAG TPA: bifunctional glutamate N-acetyltransferase/amino-acid acetyltransferase ArgJ [Pseudomonadales bacterium]|nr:bifunctional glutamate N-acetyltransferase/amino-acid acetyltransferase ArgJ [Pseudomonadales bacterium]